MEQKLTDMPAEAMTLLGDNDALSEKMLAFADDAPAFERYQKVAKGLIYQQEAMEKKAKQEEEKKERERKRKEKAKERKKKKAEGASFLATLPIPLWAAGGASFVFIREGHYFLPCSWLKKGCSKAQRLQFLGRYECVLLFCVSW